jgi:signal transduction histidine kinase
MSDPTVHRLPAYARKLLRAATFPELLAVTAEEVRAATGYRHVWFFVADREDASELRLLDYSGPAQEVMWEVAPVLKVAGDRFLEELVASDGPVVIEDARLDPRTDKAIVEKLQNRTLVNIPLRLLDKPLGFLGVGTFGDEGCRAPGPEQLEHLVGVAAQLTVAAGRIRFIEARLRAERDRQEYERRLLQVQKLESLGMLAGGIAHDFNNLLTVILSCATMAQDKAAEPEVQVEIAAVIEAGVRARELTRQLLAMSRHQDLTLRPVDLNARLGQLTGLLRRVLPETIGVDLVEGTRLPLIEGDESQLDQVFMNLCVNARDAMPDGGRLTVKTEQVLIDGHQLESHPWARPGRYALVTVTDTGVGMPRAIIDRVFEPFFTTKPPHAGTGLGLAVAYGIVRQHGGMLACGSEVGVGTTFTIYLPALERLAAAGGTKPAPGVPRATGEERILVAEDDARVREVAARILRRAGYRVDAVESGDAACALVGRAPFDLIILDVVMPGLPCRQVVERLHTLRPGLRILLASGYTAGHEVGELVEQTGAELLRKPYEPDGLLRDVRRALDRG